MSPRHLLISSCLQPFYIPFPHPPLLPATGRANPGHAEKGPQAQESRSPGRGGKDGKGYRGAAQEGADAVGGWVREGGKERSGRPAAEGMGWNVEKGGRPVFFMWSCATMPRAMPFLVVSSPFLNFLGFSIPTPRRGGGGGGKEDGVKGVRFAPAINIKKGEGEGKAAGGGGKGNRDGESDEEEDESGMTEAEKVARKRDKARRKKERKAQRYVWAGRRTANSQEGKGSERGGHSYQQVQPALLPTSPRHALPSSPSSEKQSAKRRSRRRRGTSSLPARLR